MKKRMRILTGILVAALLLGGFGLIPFIIKYKTAEKTISEVSVTESESQAGDSSEDSESTGETEDSETEDSETEDSETQSGSSEDASTGDPVLDQANLLAAQYNYDKAIELLKSQPDYDTDQNYIDAVAGYQTEKDSCVEYPLEKITHVFFHTLIKDTSKAFDGDSDEAGYNQYMTTISEFNKIIQSMYDKGYVIVSPHDMATVNDDGTMSRGSIKLPEGKIPFVLSQDDVSYYHYMTGDGFASRLIVDDEGKIRNEYIEDDGSVSVGDYDMVPLLDRFIEQHPDFSYHGRKGVLAMTGYDGVLGYRTDIAYKTRENLQDDQQEFLDNNPDFDYDQEVADAKKVADVMKAEGWEFASHTWGHKNVAERSLEDLKTDDANWKAYVKPILGDTDMIIFAFGADIGDWQGYSSDNEKFQFYKSTGYDYYCNVDSNQYFVQITDQYFRQGRRNLDGYRMYYNPEMLSDLFTVSDVWDSSRPTPVPAM